MKPKRSSYGFEIDKAAHRFGLQKMQANARRAAFFATQDDDEHVRVWLRLQERKAFCRQHGYPDPCNT